ncbi:CBS domain-containing protein [Hazenella sp. IB182353]|uniref:CBS domain-containing protein n=1 Tax=Polycladospora coralii TaxID=2771432 RepID=UPI0017461851|nr:CBS domain-containing protein [Polycladospora coralii]MBS7529897.1 CBS domain-containing protein [Polycladospora coralii]
MATLRDVMTSNIQSVTAQDNVYEVASMMRQNNIGMVPVLENGVLKGVVTDRDLVTRGIANKKANSSSISEVMSNQLVVGTPDMTVEEAARIMADAQVRRLPVVENNQIVGVVSLGDLALQPTAQDDAAVALNEISETHNPQASNDLQA